MNGLNNIAASGSGHAIAYLGILGLLLTIILTILALIHKEDRAPYGLGLGVIIFILMVAGLELPGVVKARFNKPAQVAQTTQPAEPAPEPTPQPAPEQPAPQPAQTVAEQPAPEQPAQPAQPAQPVAVPVPVPQPAPPNQKPGGLQIQEQPKPQPAKPVPAPAAPPPAQPQPQPKPAVPTPQPAPAPEPPRTAPGGGHRMAVSTATSGVGTVDIAIHGPIIETTKEVTPNAHLMIILDSKYTIVVLPTRANEQKKENEFGEQVINSVTYFWENVHAAFNNVPPGPHSVMIDASLEAPATHKSKMVGSGNVQNSYNGFAQVTDGGVVQMVFGAMLMNQELERIR